MEGDEESSPGSDLITAERKADKNAVHTYLNIICLIMKQQKHFVEGAVEEVRKPVQTTRTSHQSNLFGQWSLLFKFWHLSSIFPQKHTNKSCDFCKREAFKAILRTFADIIIIYTYT